ncbi:hypothetical protein GOP47_0022403 [Adiantum capillus-veneris]|uniref:Uncharacterized protein n=1 Tax=Adiantum capillus-veneris TaxID=13818 RepID=A0A9D4U599_ADICA|nr:hypothetical protein GOP47_0022403 [Adiantum capillus-veneris]
MLACGMVVFSSGVASIALSRGDSTLAEVGYLRMEDLGSPALRMCFIRVLSHFFGSEGGRLLLPLLGGKWRPILLVFRTVLRRSRQGGVF